MYPAIEAQCFDEPLERLEVRAMSQDIKVNIWMTSRYEFDRTDEELMALLLDERADRYDHGRLMFDPKKSPCLVWINGLEAARIHSVWNYVNRNTDVADLRHLFL